MAIVYFAAWRGHGTDVVPSFSVSATPSPNGIGKPSPPGLRQFFWRDGVLRIAFLIGGLLIAVQLVLTVLHPTWIGSFIDWIRAALAWPELAVVVLVSLWLTRARHPAAMTWWFLSTALLSYAVARTLWTIYDQFLYPNHVPFPVLPDIFFLLQYPFFLLALMMLPGDPPWDLRLRTLLDCVLLLGAAGALSWYFILAPIYLLSGESLEGKFINLAYTMGDLGMVFGLAVAFIYRDCHLARTVLGLLIAAFLCLVLADTWATSFLLYSSHVYRSGNPPDVFWNAFYLLVPLAGLVQVRFTRRTQVAQQEVDSATHMYPSFQRDDFNEVMRVLSPLVVALLACAVIAFRAIIAPPFPGQPLGPVLIILGLLLLVMLRQGITVLENAQLRRKWAFALAHEHALNEINRRMEAFLGIAGHELKTPLTTVILSLQMLQRRALQRVPPAEGSAGRGGGGGNLLT